MCICLPNGKFNFKFSRSYPCLGKKDSKHKHNLTLIEESSEEEEIHNKIIISNGNGLKKDGLNVISSEIVNHQGGHYRQLSRDRQLPPVPDSGDLFVLQGNSLRKSSIKHKNKTVDSPVLTKEHLKPNNEEYGSICESETYMESKSNAQSPTTVQPGVFKLISADEMKDVDPLYASVIPQIKRTEINEKPSVTSNYENDIDLLNHLNDHGYSIIIKKSTMNEFSSLRKPERPKPSKDACRQSLQSLNNQAPGLPIRQYKQSELYHLANDDFKIEPEIKLRENNPLHSEMNSIRRFSQPPILKQHSFSSYNDDNVRQDQDVLKSLQSTFNTPPTKRASLTNICQIISQNSDSNLENRTQSRERNSANNTENETEANDSVDLYRHITVRESLASLRARNALPDDTVNLSFQPSSVVSPALQHVYEGLYETLYYSSADNARNGPPSEAPRIRQTILPQSSSPLPYLGQDNYLSIAEHPYPYAIFNISNPTNSVIPNSSIIRSNNDRSSVVYTAAGSDVYAEISDVYQSKQYEELPDTKLCSKPDGGQINNGFIGCNSPGSVRVMLEIQSFRHMDSDVDISSRCTTPLHPLGKSIIMNSNKLSSSRNSESSELQSNVIRHPWYLPQKTSLVSQQQNNKPSSSSLVLNKPPIPKPKPPQNNLAIMTPLMERSMEGSSMFLDENRNSQSGFDCLYDLFKYTDSQTANRQSPGKSTSRHHKDSSIDEKDKHSSNGNVKAKRIIYPNFSEPDF